MRRERFVVEADLSAEELAGRLNADPRRKTVVLVLRDGHFDFVELRGGGVGAGDEISFYEYDPANEADLLAINRALVFSPLVYIGNASTPWPDERRVIDELVPASDARVLEICCGAGRLGPALARDGNQVVGLDLDAHAVAYARAAEGAGVAWMIGDALALPFADATFDVGCVFENSLGVFFSQKSRALDELVRVTRTRVIIGLREHGADPDRAHVYYSYEGNLEVAQTFTPASAVALVEGISAEQRARIGARRTLPGEPRPWGGRELFVVLELL